MTNEDITKEAGKLVVQIVQVGNVMGRTTEIPEAMFEALCGTHRTLQASFWRNIQDLAKLYGEAPSDARNEAAVEFARQVGKLDSYIPMV